MLCVCGGTWFGSRNDNLLSLQTNFVSIKIDLKDQFLTRIKTLVTTVSNILYSNSSRMKIHTLGCVISHDTNRKKDKDSICDFTTDYINSRPLTWTWIWIAVGLEIFIRSFIPSWTRFSSMCWLWVITEPDSLFESIST